MGRRSVHDGRPQLGQDERVQRIRVAGAQHLHRLQARGLGVAAHPAHEAGLAAARAAFDDVQRLKPLRVGQLMVKGIKARGRVSPEKVLDFRHSPKASS